MFLGTKKDIESEGGKLLMHLSQIDRFTFDQQKVGYFWNDDPKCFEKYDLDPKRMYLLMLNGENAIESHIPLTEDNF